MRIAQHHSKPEGGVQLEIECAAGTILARGHWRINRQGQMIESIGPGTGLIRIEQQRGFIMAGIMAIKLLIVP